MNALPSVEQPRARTWPIPCAIALGCLALATRTTSLLSLGPTVAIGILGIAGVVGRPDQRKVAGARFVIVTLLGVGALVVVRVISPPILSVYTPEAFMGNLIAAVAEEAFFRRFVYGWIAGRSESLAIVVAAALFAVIHVPIYGVAVLPLDFAAGLLLGWQRRESGTWISPAVTHVIANILQMR